MTRETPFRFPESGDPAVALAGISSSPRIAEAMEAVEAELAKRFVTHRFELQDEPDLAGCDCHAVIVVGGDGSILRAANFMADRQKPALGVNVGKLGFLADIQPEAVGRVADQLLGGTCRVVKHVMLDCTARLSGGEQVERLALNEVTVRAGAPFGMIDVDLFIDDELVTTYSCDGVLLSTPIGSTAHSLSAGGPILRKNLESLVVTPLSPHTLTNRPVVDSADRRYEFAMSAGSPGAAVVIDGNVCGELSGEGRVSIARAKSVFQLIEAPGHSYYRTLREKLHWGGGLRRRPRE